MPIHDKLADLKFKLNSAMKQKLRKEIIVHSLRSKESSVTEEISLTKEENESFIRQINELTSQISQMKSQIIMIDVCRASEESKINVIESNLNDYKNGYDELYAKVQSYNGLVAGCGWVGANFTHLQAFTGWILTGLRLELCIPGIKNLLIFIERDVFEQQNKQQKQKEAEEEEIERAKLIKVLEKNEHQAKEAAAIEKECEAIERECSVLTKRNKAIMLKLRRKLIETEDIRRELTKKKENTETIQEFN
ncbi:uncharacterized protein LOC119831930 [Zerene cesonia]|uniref:uncharacterized protein LOC119831930 n=1 Tax=Zerene cesonia TaxID=33412 RepID=UPI0018E505CD|nr:uncharacterized protein LOC119831930 [Zerene cesonia]